MDKIPDNLTSNPHKSLMNSKLNGNLLLKVIGEPIQILTKKCIITLQLVNEKKFKYLLIVTNEDIIEDEISKWKTKTYPISKHLGFKLITEDENEYLIWEHDKNFHLFKILKDNNNTKEEKDNFFSNLVNLISSHEYEIDTTKAIKQETKEEFLVKYNNVKNIEQFLEDKYKNLYKKEEKNKDDSETLSKEFNNKLKTNQLYFKKIFPKVKAIFEAAGTLLKYDKSTDDLITLSSNAKLGIFKSEKDFQYYLVIDENSTEIEKTWTYILISREINIMTPPELNVVMWLGKDNVDITTPNSTISNLTAYNFSFKENFQINAINKVIALTQYETATLSKFSDLDDEERTYLEQENIQDISHDSYINQPDVEMDLANEYQEEISDLTNKITAQAYQYDRTFVIRNDNTIGIYKIDDEDILSHLSNLPAIKEYDDKTIDIKTAQMFNSDTQLVLTDINHEGSAFSYDLNKAKIVEEWCSDSVFKIDALTHETKFGQMTDSQLMTGLNNNTLFTLDARINKKDKVVQTKNYKTNPTMTCLVTTDFGAIATGSKLGEIRLYDKVGKNAKTLLPCFGHAIKSIDTTSDGRYVLATCDNYLILIPTTCKGDNIGFLKQMGKEKPNPKTLKIKPSDVKKYELENLTFTAARFNVNKNTGETDIITSLDDYVIVWNFVKIKKGILDDYKIKKFNDRVLDNQFKYNKSQLVVTMENKLRIQNQKKLFD